MIGQFKFTKEMLSDVQDWIRLGELYIASDGSVSNERGDHGFAITSGVQRATIWGGAATTRGNKKEMTLIESGACRVYCNNNTHTYSATSVKGYNNSEDLDRQLRSTQENG